MSNLKRLADQMMRDAIEKRDIVRKHGVYSIGGIDEKPLRGGVRLRLMADETHFQLLVIRVGVFPSDVEMRVFQDCFGCPDATPTQGIAKGDWYKWVKWDIPEKFKAQQQTLEMKTAAN